MIPGTALHSPDPAEESGEWILRPTPGTVVFFPTSTWHRGCSMQDGGNGMLAQGHRRRVFFYLDWETPVKTDKGGSVIFGRPEDGYVLCRSECKSVFEAMAFLSSPLAKKRSALGTSVGTLFSSLGLQALQSKKRPRAARKNTPFCVCFIVTSRK